MRSLQKIQLVVGVRRNRMRRLRRRSMQLLWRRIGCRVSVRLLKVLLRRLGMSLMGLRVLLLLHLSLLCLICSGRRLVCALHSELLISFSLLRLLRCELLLPFAFLRLPYTGP